MGFTGVLVHLQAAIQGTEAWHERIAEAIESAQAKLARAQEQRWQRHYQSLGCLASPRSETVFHPFSVSFSLVFLRFLADSVQFYRIFVDVLARLPWFSEADVKEVLRRRDLLPGLRIFM